MARDLFVRQNRCHYCGRAGCTVWDVDLVSCSREVCRSLAFAEARRRRRTGREPAPEQRLKRALRSALDTLELELREDRDADVVEAAEARLIDESERRRTARLLAEIDDREHPLEAPHVTRLRPAVSVERPPAAARPAPRPAARRRLRDRRAPRPRGR